MCDAKKLTVSGLYHPVPRRMIFGTSYVEGQTSRYLFSQWLDLVTALNPEADVLVVDSASPDLPGTGRAEVLQLGDNIGHLTKTGRDGWGRAFCAGLQYALSGEYDQVVHIETDLLFGRPVAPTLDKMAHSRVKVAAPTAHPYQFIETGLWFADVDYIRTSNLPMRYILGGSDPTEYPEIKLEKLVAAEIFTLPLRGLRNDLGGVTAKNMRQFFPGGIDWITHADPAVCREFLKVNGHG